MQNMNYYYDFSGQKFGYPLSLSINSFNRVIFSRTKSLEICYVLKGKYEVVTEHFLGHINERELVLIAPDEIHKVCKHASRECVILTIHIDFSRLPPAMVGDVKESFASMLCTEEHHPELLKAFKKCISRLIRHLHSGDYNLFELNKLMMELISIASDSKRYPIEKLPLLSDYNENYMKAICFIDRHYSEDIHLEDVARALNFSISYTSKLLKKYTQIPFVKYLSYVRIRASLEALLEGKRSIERIAQECGMPNTKAYTNAFKELYGILPSAYRKQFIRNMKYNDENLDQEMLLDDEQILLLSHLLEEDENILFEDETIRMVRIENGYLAEMKQAPEELRLKEKTVSFTFPEKG